MTYSDFLRLLEDDYGINVDLLEQAVSDVVIKTLLAARPEFFHSFKLIAPVDPG